jgi:hypothetical protein
MSQTRLDSKPPSALSSEARTNAPATASQQSRRSTVLVVAAVALAVVLLTVLIFAVYALLQPDAPTERWRDIFIIILAMESMVIGVALIVLLIQLASLINLLQNEVKPILYATSETVNTLRGTAQFLGESVVEPVIKLNGYLAGLRRVLQLMGIKQK